MVYGYVRVSTKGQEEGNSIEDQQQQILNRYPDSEIIIESASGAKERGLFNALLARIRDNDLLAVTTLDRFCRTTKEGLQYIDRLRKRGVIIHIMNMGVIEDTVMGRLIVTNLLAFAEFERAMIIERTQRGKAIAKQDPDYREGRPRAYGEKQIDHALGLLESKTYRQVEELTGISKSTLIRAKRKSELPGI